MTMDDIPEIDGEGWRTLLGEDDDESFEALQRAFAVAPSAPPDDTELDCEPVAKRPKRRRRGPWPEPHTPEWYDRKSSETDEELDHRQEARAKISALLEALFGRALPDELTRHGATNVRRFENHNHLTATLPGCGTVSIGALTVAQFPMDPSLMIGGDQDMAFVVGARYALPLDEACDRVRIRVRAALHALASVRSGLTRSPLPLQMP